MSFTRSLLVFLAVVVSSEAGSRRAPDELPSGPSPPNIGPFLLNCGASDNVNVNGETWVPDSQFVRGGEATGNNVPVAGADTGTEALFTTARVDSVTSRRSDEPRGFEYTISFSPNERRGDGELAVNSFFKLTLYFSEPEYAAANAREFNVLVNGDLTLPRYDIYDEAGGALNRATDVEYFGIRPVDNGNDVVVTFKSVQNQAWVNAIRLDILSEYIILVNCGFVGEVALSDKYFYGGEAITNLQAVTGNMLPDFASLFFSERRSEREFNRRGQPTGIDEIYYALPAPVTANTYRVVFGFAETVHNSAGQRIFSVRINGVPVPELTNLDIWDRVGQNTALEIPVTGIESIDGLIKVEFVSIQDVASVRYIQYSNFA